MKRLIAMVLPVLVASSLACNKNEPQPVPVETMAPATLAPLPAPLAVSMVTLGTAIGSDKKVTASAETFAPRDTIYAVVDTTGAGHAKLRALWSFVKGEKTAKVDETTVEIDPAVPASTEFHVMKPSGWPKGDYRVEIFLNDAAVASATKGFKVG